MKVNINLDRTKIQSVVLKLENDGTTSLQIQYDQTVLEVSADDNDPIEWIKEMKSLLDGSSTTPGVVTDSVSDSMEEDTKDDSEVIPINKSDDPVQSVEVQAELTPSPVIPKHAAPPIPNPEDQNVLNVPDENPRTDVGSNEEPTYEQLLSFYVELLRSRELCILDIPEDILIGLPKLINESEYLSWSMDMNNNSEKYKDHVPITKQQVIDRYKKK